MLDVNNNLACIEKLIYDAATDSRQWPKFLETLGKILTAKAVVWAESDLSSQSGRICHSVGIDYEFIRSYEERYVQQNPWLHACTWYIPGQVGRGEDIIASNHCCPVNNIIKSVS